MSTREVIEFAKRHGGVIATHEALELGMARSTVKRRVDDGVFVRLGRGVLALPGTSTRPDALMRAAGRLMGAVVSHVSAARIHRMEPLISAPPTVTVAHRGSYRFPGLQVVQSTDLLPEHVMEIGAVRLTTPPRTIADLARFVSERRLQKIVHNANVAGIVEIDDLIVLHQALSRQGKKGLPALGRILKDLNDGDLVPISVLEGELLDLLIRASLPVPTREFRAPWLQPDNGRVDFAYVAEEVLIEADSHRWHRTPEAFETDRRRDIAAQLHGWIVIRITWQMITKDPSFVADSVRNALALRQSGSRGSSTRIRF